MYSPTTKSPPKAAPTASSDAGLAGFPGAPRPKRDPPTRYSRTGHFGRPGAIAPAEEPPVRTYGEGRTCAHPGCGARLSRYNPHPYCALHENESYDPRTLDRPTTEDGRWICAVCGKARLPYFRHWSADRRSKDGFNAECRYCHAEIRREQKNAQTREHRKQQREAAP